MGKWWTTLFPDVFSDDYQDVGMKLRTDPFGSIENIFEVQFVSNPSSYELTSMFLQLDNSRTSKRVTVTIDSKAYFEQGLFNIARDMENVIASYFKQKKILDAMGY